MRDKLINIAGFILNGFALFGLVYTVSQGVSLWG